MAIATDLQDRIDLAGAWQLAFDPAGQGIGEGWAPGRWPRDRAETVQVPTVWERTHPDAEGVGFYHRVFTVPSEWAQRVLYLRFGGASYRTEVWLNDHFLGSHEGAYTPIDRSTALPLLTPAIVLEQIARGSALDDTTWDRLLRAWAAGPPEGALAKEAAAALGRLGKARPGPKP